MKEEKKKFIKLDKYIKREYKKMKKKLKKELKNGSR